MIVTKKRNRMTGNTFRLTMLTKALLGLREVEIRETVEEILGEGGIYVGDLGDATKASGDLESAEDVDWADRCVTGLR